MTDHKNIKLAKFFDDPLINKYKSVIKKRIKRAEDTEKRLTNNKIYLSEFANGHEYFGVHKCNDHWVIREWAPHAKEICLIGDFNNWKKSEDFYLSKLDVQTGIWELKIPLDKMHHNDLYKLNVKWNEGEAERLPAFVRRVIQDEKTKIFAAQIWDPKKPYLWKHPNFSPSKKPPMIYESHIGMGQEKQGVGTYEEFRVNTLPRIIKAGYNTVQIMALMEHPYYGSFGYHVSNFFSASSRFGTPHDLKRLIDEAHNNGIAIIMDLVHSHAVKNELEGISKLDGTDFQYFHGGEKGTHNAWDSKCFNYGKTEVLHFLLSNCRYWIDEYKIDGYRFDGITSMMYYDHGLGTDFGAYDHYFDESVDEDAIAYLTLANKLIHNIKPNAVTIAEDVSGMPGLGAPIKDGGIGFNYRLALGIPDYWFKHIQKIPDEYWNVEEMFFKLTDHRDDEKTISYVECHDQAIVGNRTMSFELMNTEMYTQMDKNSESMVVDRGIALHKMIRLITIATANGGYLNFMGNEFGHPEWVDFPREGNNLSYKYSRRQWNLVDNGFLRYEDLGKFDRVMLRVISKHDSIDRTCSKSYSNCENKILAFIRGDLVFVFNFHPVNSINNYFIDLPKGKYKLILDSDEKQFGGHGRIGQSQYFETIKDKNHGIKVYLPCRTCMILQKI